MELMGKTTRVLRERLRGHTGRAPVQETLMVTYRSMLELKIIIDGCFQDNREQETATAPGQVYT